MHPELDLRRIRDVTANFFFWQGLRWVPLGAALLLFTWSTLPGFPIAAPWRDAIPSFVFGGLGLTYMVGGILDHFELRRMLRARGTHDHVEAV